MVVVSNDGKKDQDYKTAPKSLVADDVECFLEFEATAFKFNLHQGRPINQYRVRD